LATSLRDKHLLGIEGLTSEEIVSVLDTAEAFFEVTRRPIRKVPTLRGKTILNLFYENSTRTRTSFELAGKRLSADVVNMSASSSSTTKGETLLDTVRTLEAMRPDVVVIRHGASGAPHYVSERVGCSIVNAGDGLHEHPTQALLDAFTIRRAKGKLSGLKIAICGDVAHSRVARSNALLLKLMGNEGADVVMMLRIQKERLEGALLPSMREYARTFGLNAKRLAAAAPDAVVMHPGPMNRGVEINADVADGKQSLILEQVEAGVAVRMAVLYMLSAEPGMQSSVTRIPKD